MFEALFLKDLREGVSQRFRERYQKERSPVEFRYMRVEGTLGTEYEGGCIEYPNAGTALPLIEFHSLVGEYWKEDGFAMKEAVEKVVKEAERHLLPVDFSIMGDFWQVKDRLSMELVNRERNQEKLSRKPYIPFLDMAIRFWVELGSYQGKTAACLVTWKEMEEWGITLKELYQAARQNLRKEDIRISSIGDVLEKQTGLWGDDSEQEATPLFMMTTKQSCYGAVSMLAKEVLRSFTREHGWEWIYIIPSSIHEVLLLPPGICEIGQLVEMVRQVNDSIVSSDDILSYHVYQYQDRTGKVLDLCSK